MVPSENEILQALRAVSDPEVGVNIVDLGLIYSIEPAGDRVRIAMTMTTPACPMHSYLAEQVREAILCQFEDVTGVEVNLVWDPPWSPQMISERGQRELGWR
jgi:metal-sulfur cluster biosynthetic enzyme